MTMIEIASRNAIRTAAMREVATRDKSALPSHHSDNVFPAPKKPKRRHELDLSSQLFFCICSLSPHTLIFLAK